MKSKKNNRFHSSFLLVDKDFVKKIKKYVKEITKFYEIRLIRKRMRGIIDPLNYIEDIIQNIYRKKEGMLWKH